MIHLSICIPTFNRHEPLKLLNEKFLSKVLELFPDNVEVLICDDSELAIAQANQLVLHKKIRYQHNPVRTGFASSLEWCFEQAEGKFVWLLSDDDPIFWDGFCRLLALIKLDKADCYIVPIKWVTIFNETRVDHFNKFNACKSFSVDQMFLDDPGFLPFILLSAGVVRLDKSVLKLASTKLKGNLFMHIAMYLDMLTPASRVVVADQPVVNYQLTRKHTYTVETLFEMRLAVLNYLTPQFTSLQTVMPEQIDAALQHSLQLMVENDIGIVQMKPLSQSHKKMRRYYWKYRQKPNYPAMMILMLPPVFSRVWYYVLNAMDYVRVYGSGASVLRKCQLALASYKKLKKFAVFKK
jgi:glycosyltransferase involved in cell wall biosynthesis